MRAKSNYIFIWFISVCIFGLIVVPQAWSTTYYVDVLNGFNDNDGTSTGTAWRTIEFAVARLGDNDQLNVAPGTYVPVDTGGIGAVDVTKSGVTIQGSSGVVIDGGGPGGPTCWSSGFDISGSDVVLKDLEITRFECDGTKAVRIQSGSNNRIESCIISNSDYGIVFDTGSDTGNVVEDCTIHDNYRGVDIQDASPQILRNTIYDNSTNINVYNSSGTNSPDIFNNLIYRTISGTYGIYIYAFNVAVQPLIYHNTIYGVETGIYLVANEISGVNNANIQYNIISTNPSSGTGIYYTSNYGTNFNGTVDYNDVWSSFTRYSGVSAGPNDLSIDPLFVDAGNFNFHLGPASLLLDLIQDASDTVKDDRDGAVRPMGLGSEMGCYEIDVSNSPPAVPIPVGPVDEKTFGEMDPIPLDGGLYSDPENHDHSLTYFRVRRADNKVLAIDQTFFGGVTDYTIPYPTTLIPRLKYLWQVGYVDQLGAESWSDTQSFKIGTSVPESLPEVQAGTDLGDFGMISLVHWPDDPSAEAVFNIEYDPRNYRIGTYDAVNNRYIEFGNNLEMEPGRSYWILAREGLTINFSGVPVSQAVEVYVALDYNSNTSNGWNMVAPPNGAYYWGDVRVVEAIDGTLVDKGAVQSLADENLYIDRQLWRWENGHYHSDTDPFQEMAVYAGYWVKVRQANVFLKFDPADQIIVPMSTSETLMDKAWHKTKTWLSNLNIFTQEAVAVDGDTPPMPMGGLDDNNVDPVFQGCFIETAERFYLTNHQD